MLMNPGSILISDSTFQNNEGILGTCIYYSEIKIQRGLILNNNRFINNRANLGGGALFLESKYNEILLNANNNLFKNNSAIYGNDFTTSPFRLFLEKNANFKITKNKLITITVLPGLAEVNLNFQLLDYFNQKITNFSNANSKIQIRNYVDFSEKVDPKLKLEGKTTVGILNGLI